MSSSKRFSKNWLQVLKENQHQKMLNIILIIMLVFSVYALTQKSTTVVMIPPTLDKRAEISKNAASQEYIKSWALFIATLLGNVAPNNADFIAEELVNLFSTKLYQKMRETLAEEIEKIKENRISTNFFPKKILFSEVTGTVFVIGDQITKTPISVAKKRKEKGLEAKEKYIRTFEMQIKIRSFSPLVVGFEVYKGAPTQDKLKQLNIKDEQ